MKIKSYLFTILTLCLLLILSAEYGTAQELTSETIPLSPDETEAMVMGRIPIQGQLTNDAGDPLNGSFSVTFRLYDSATAGTQLCQDTKTLSLDNGLFSTAMEGCTVSDINGRQVYLGIQVGSDPEMTPRQPIYPVPYAYSLVPGADLRGSLGGQAMFTVDNGSGEFSSGIYGLASAPTGMNYGVHGKSNSATGYGGYFENTGGTALKANGAIQSSALSHVWISGNGVRPFHQNDTTIIDMDTVGGALVSRGAAAGKKNVMLPITVPGVLYGQNVKVTHLYIYWRGDLAADNVTAVLLRRQTGVGSYVNIVFQTLQTFSCADELYPDGCTIHYELTNNNVLTQDSGILYLTIEMEFASETSWFQIGGVRLALEHD
jgi:hypothetical protein